MNIYILFVRDELSTVWDFAGAFTTMYNAQEAKKILKSVSEFEGIPEYYLIEEHTLDYLKKPV